MNKLNLALFALSILIVSSLLSSASISDATLLHAPRIRYKDSNYLSTNWGGYAVTGSRGSVSDVKASWIVPAIVGTCPSTNRYSSFWVGIDGFNDNTVEQIGTDSDCQNGSPVYYTWYEFYPHPSYGIFYVHPGDIISAETKYLGNNKFQVSINDLTTKQSFSTSAKVNAQRSSAEWITEAPYSGGILPLADFGTAYYGYDNTGVSSTSYATVKSVTAPIGSFGSSIQYITMVTSSGTPKATPSVLSTDGSSFSVLWNSAGP